MSCTSADIIVDGYRILTVIDANENPSAEQMQIGLAVLNDTLANMDEDGIRVDWYPQTDVTVTTPLRDEDIRNVKLIFASELALRWGVSISQSIPDLVEKIDSAVKALAKRSLDYVDSDLTGLPWAQGGLFGPGRA